VLDVATPALDEVRRETPAVGLVLPAREVVGKVGETAVQEGRSDRKASSFPLWGVAVTRMRCRSGFSVSPFRS